jgi:hypothetical protein
MHEAQAATKQWQRCFQADCAAKCCTDQPRQGEHAGDKTTAVARSTADDNECN